MRLILIRHPETEANAKELVYGKMDYPYTELGHQQMALVLEDISRFSVEQIITSPLGRAKKLGLAIGELCGMKVEEVEAFEEMNFGVLEGLTKEEAKERHLEIYDKVMSGDLTYTVPDGESYNDFKKRVCEGLKKVRATDTNTIIVSHAVVIRTILEEVIDLKEGFSWQFHIGNCAIIDLDLSRSYGKINNIINIRETKNELKKY